MEAFYQWIRNIAGYFIFLTVLEQILPGKNYEKYIRLFEGVILILLVVQPLTDSARISENIVDFYRKLEFQYDAEDLKKDILGNENIQLKHLIERYETSIAADLQMMAQDLGAEAENVSVTICSNRDDAAFGSVEHIRLSLRAGVGQVQTIAARLRERILSYYHLEVSDVEIQTVEGKG